MSKPVMNSDLARVEIEVSRLIDEYPELAADLQLRADMIEGSTAFPDVAHRLLRVEREAGAMAAGLSSYIDKLLERAGVYERRQDSAKRMLQRLMEIADVKTFRLPEATLSLAATPPKALVADPESLPDEYMRVKREPNMAKIKEALQAQTTVPGAYLSNGGQSLRIR